MTALEKLTEISKSRPLTDAELLRMEYLVKRAARSPEQRERDRIKRRQSYAEKREIHTASRRGKCKDDDQHRQNRLSVNRTAYRRKVMADKEGRQ